MKIAATDLRAVQFWLRVNDPNYYPNQHDHALFDFLF